MEEAKKMRPREYIKIRGANEHNLKNINVDIPRTGGTYRDVRFRKVFPGI